MDEFRERINAPVIAGALSLVVPGAGQFYNRYALRGLAFLLSFALALRTIGAFAYLIAIGSVVESVLIALADGQAREHDPHPRREQ